MDQKVVQGRRSWLAIGGDTGAVVNLFSVAFLTGYLTVEYIWPYIKRRWWNRSEIQRRLQVMLPLYGGLALIMQLKKPVSLTKHEEELAYGALHPADIATGFADVGGNEEAILRLKQVTALLLSTQGATLHASRLFQAPSGVLLYGPPGCGKTMIAKALAKESNVRFISVNLATIMDKWVGETEKYIEALFTLARKISPVIIFVDEIDALTKKRGSFDREWSAGMKSQLLTFWDGLHSDSWSQIIVPTVHPRLISKLFRC